MGPRDLMIIVSEAIERLGARYYVTGSMASMAYGEYRSTLDVDLVIELEYRHIDGLLAAFREPEYYLIRPPFSFRLPASAYGRWI